MNFLKLKLGPVLSIILITLLILTTVLVIQNKGFHGVLTVMQGGRVHRETVNGLQFTVYFNKKSYTVDEEIKFKAKVKNVSKNPIIYDAGDSYPSHEDSILAGITDSIYSMRFIYVPFEGENIQMTGEFHYTPLKPGQSLVRDFTYLPKIHDPSGSPIITSVSKGEHIADIGIRLEEEFVKITIPIIISEGSEKIISVEEAVNIASAHQDVQKWIEDRSAKDVTKEEQGEYYELTYYGWSKISKETYDNILKSDKYKTYDETVTSGDGYWHIIYTSKLGNAPYRVEVKVDAKIGEIKSVETFEKFDK